MSSNRFKELVRLYGYNYACNVFNKRIELEKKQVEGLIKAEKEQKRKLKESAKRKNQKHKKNRKAKKKIKKTEKRKTLEQLALSLENNLPKSEVWFRELYEQHLKIDTDHYNQVYNNLFIPDVINHQFKYIIEIDGSIHLEPSVESKDLSRNQYFRNQGFKVLRIQAYDFIQYIQVMRLLCKIRKIDEPEVFKKFTLQYFK